MNQGGKKVSRHWLVSGSRREGLADRQIVDFGLPVSDGSSFNKCEPPAC